MLRASGKDLPTAVPPPRVVQHISRLRGPQQHQRYDLVVASYSLGELPTAEARRAVVHRLWGHCADMLLLIEPGTPAGSAIIREARAEVIRLEARRLRAAGGRQGSVATDGGAGRLLTDAAIDGDLDADGQADGDDREAQKGVLTQDHCVATRADRQPPIGAHVIAPCAHEHSCPLDGTSHWCHFSQRVARTAAQRAVKGAGSRTYQDERYSYVVLRRGMRPASVTPGAVALARATAPVIASGYADDSLSDDAQDDDENTREVTGPSEAAISLAIAAAAAGWARVLRPPRKAKGHVVLQLCTPSGDLAERVVAASHVKALGPTSYRMARKARWGDAWPHAAVPRRVELLAAEEDALGMRAIGLLREPDNE